MALTNKQISDLKSMVQATASAAMGLDSSVPVQARAIAKISEAVAAVSKIKLEKVDQPDLPMPAAQASSGAKKTS